MQQENKGASANSPKQQVEKNNVEKMDASKSSSSSHSSDVDGILNQSKPRKSKDKSEVEQRIIKEISSLARRAHLQGYFQTCTFSAAALQRTCSSKGLAHRDPKKAKRAREVAASSKALKEELEDEDALLSAAARKSNALQLATHKVLFGELNKLDREFMIRQINAYCKGDQENLVCSDQTQKLNDKSSKPSDWTTAKLKQF